MSFQQLMTMGSLCLLVLACERGVGEGRGARHQCEVREGKVFCWGANTHGQLGLGDLKDRAKKEDAEQVNLGFDDAIAVAMGEEHTCALSKTGKVKCWGGNLYGQLGTGERGTRGSSADEMGDKLPAVNYGKGKAILLALGADHSCVALEDGGVKCWGHNDDGQLGIGDRNNRGSSAKDLGEALKAASAVGEAKVKALVAGGEYNATCAQTDDGWKCWGHEADAKKIKEKQERK